MASAAPVIGLLVVKLACATLGLVPSWSRAEANAQEAPDSSSLFLCFFHQRYPALHVNMISSTVAPKCGGSLLAKLLLVGCCTSLLLVAHYCYRSTAFDFAKHPGPQTHHPVSRPIPAKLWQNWITNSAGSAATNMSMSDSVEHRWKASNPEWQTESITKDNVDEYAQHLFPDSVLTQAFAKLKKPQLKIDLLRYFILYEEGGVWTDMDIVPHQPISNWIPEPYRDWGVNLVVGVEVDNHKRPIWEVPPYSVQICQYTILTAPEHPVFKTLTEKATEGLKKLIDSNKLGNSVVLRDIMGNSKSLPFTRVLLDYLSEVSGEYFNGDQMDRLDSPMLVGDVLVLPKHSFAWSSHDDLSEQSVETILVKPMTVVSL